MFGLPAVKKWHFRFADRKKDMEDELRSGQSKKPGRLGPIVELLREKPFTCIGCPISGVSQRARREAAPHARGVSRARQL
jgi:hypothetical protein